MTAKELENKFDFFKKPKELTPKQKKLQKLIHKANFILMIGLSIGVSAIYDIGSFMLKIDDGIYSERNPKLHTKKNEELNKIFNKKSEELISFIDYSKGEAHYNEKGIVLKSELSKKEIAQFQEIAKELREIDPINNGTIHSASTAFRTYEITLGKDNIKTKEAKEITKLRIKELYKNNDDDIQYRYERLGITNASKLLSLKTYQDYLKTKFVETEGIFWIYLKNTNKNLNEREKLYQQEFQKLKEGKPNQFDDLFETK